MTTIVRETIIDAPAQTVWPILADFGAIYKFNPGVPTSYSTSDTNRGLGATRHCDLLPVGSIEERIIDWQEGRSYKIEIYAGKGIPPFKTAVAQLKLQPQGTKTLAQMSVEYRLNYGFLGALMDRLLVKKQYEKAVPGILAGLKHFVETGEEVSKNVNLNLQMVTAVA